MGFPPIDEDLKLWVLLHQTRDAAYKVTEKELRASGLSPIEAAILFVVNATNERATPAQISRWLFRESHSVSGLIDRMDKKGLVKRVKDLEKKNLIRISMTDKARRLADSFEGPELIHQTLAPLSDEQRQQLAASLQTMRDKALEQLHIDKKSSFPQPGSHT